MSAATRSVQFTVNGQLRSVQVEPRLNLADCLRHSLGCTGTHVGCEHGVCGACTVLVDGRSARACLMLAAQAEGCTIETVEGLATSAEELSVLQQSFWDLHGLQCGFCTPGVLMSLTELLRSNAAPSEAQVRDVLSGHLCRCTGYQNIVAAALEAARRMRGETPRQAGMAVSA
jgi:aerobic-type carbon monoxide dehydrogenase small subunit (CoxS/CutS family)